MKKLGICATEVPSDGQGLVSCNARRVAAARRIIEVHHGYDEIQLFAFPAGFLRAADEDGVLATAEPLLAIARAAKRAVVFGVDTEPLRRLSSSRVRDGTLPSHLVAWAPGVRGAAVWRQRSRTRHDAAHVSDFTARARLLPVGRYFVAPVNGGEIFNPAIRSGIGAAHPEAVVLCAHFSVGDKHWAGLDQLRAFGLPSVRSVHASKPVTQLLTAPRGYRLANMCLMEEGIFASTYFISDDDKALEAA